MTRPPLVGRAVERAGFGTALARCWAGHGGLVSVSGDAGMGKSRLVAEVLADWRGGVLRGASVPGDNAYAPVVDVLRQVRQAYGEGALPPPARALLPELSIPWRGIDQRTLVAAIQATLRDVARQRPTVVVLEDLHWANAAAVELVPGLAAALAGEAALCIVTYRGEELPRSHPVRAMRAELRRTGGFVEYPLAPLTVEQTGELVATILGAGVSPELVAAVHERAGGVPFFVEELAAGLAPDRTPGRAGDTRLPLPESVVDAVLVRTAGLRQRAGEAVEVAAVSGQRVDLAVLADLTAPAEVDRLLESGLLREHDDGTAVFRHALVRDALYRTVPWGRRRALHRRVAERLADRGGPPELIAEHWVGAQQPERARPLLLAAAERHCAVHAYRDAAALGRRALALWPDGADPGGRLTALESLAHCAELCGELDAAVTVWTEVAECSHAAGEV
ncbi:MAG: ATP-binding protein, partial [Micromonosporaceae bacterium]